MSEIEQSNADILCLQEVSGQIYAQLQDDLEAMGYKVAEKEQELSKNGHPRFYYLMTAVKEDKFELVDEELIDFYQVGYQYTMQQEEYRKQNRAVLLHLKSLKSPDE